MKVNVWIKRFAHLRLHTQQPKESEKRKKSQPTSTAKKTNLSGEMWTRDGDDIEIEMAKGKRTFQAIILSSK